MCRELVSTCSAASSLKLEREAYPRNRRLGQGGLDYVLGAPRSSLLGGSTLPNPVSGDTMNSDEYLALTASLRTVLASSQLAWT